MPRSLRAASLWLLAGLVATSCSKCGKQSASQVESDLALALPKDAQAAVLVPNLQALGEKLVILQNQKPAQFLAQLGGFPSGEAAVSAWANELGVDVRSAESLKNAGLKPTGGAAFARTGEDSVLAVAVASEPKKLTAGLAQLLGQRLGATSVRTEKGASIYSRPGEAKPEAGLFSQGNLVYIGVGEEALRLPERAALLPAAALAQHPSFANAAKRLGQGNDVLFWVTSALTGASQQPEILAGLRVSKKSLSLRACSKWPNAQSQLAPLVAKEGPPLLQSLPDGAFFFIRSGAEPSALLPYWQQWASPALARAVEGAGFDVAAFFNNLKPGGVFSISLAGQAQLSEAAAALDFRRRNPFALFHVAALAEAKDEAAAQSALAALPEVAKRLGATLTPKTKGEHQALIASYSQGEGLSIALAKNRWVAAGPEEKMWAALSKLQAEAKSVPAAWDESLNSRAFAAVLDIPGLARSLRALPSSSWGVGGFALREVADRGLTAVEGMGPLSLSAWAEESDVLGEISLGLDAPR